MKCIAITQRLICNNTYYEIRESLDIRYAELLSACGFLPLVLPYRVDFNEYFERIPVAGVFFSGGNDLNSCQCNPLSKQRDEYEKKLLEYCIKKEIPVLGVCRGMQLIAEYFGSSLKNVDGNVNVRQKLKVNDESLYEKDLKKIKDVNSYHNYAIDKLSCELRVSAMSNNKIIKAIEHKKHKVFGQMWHSEREEMFNPHEMELIKNFFNLEGF